MGSVSSCRGIIQPAWSENTAYLVSDNQTHQNSNVTISASHPDRRYRLIQIVALQRKAGERTVSGLWDLIGTLVDIFQPHECANYFSSCGYEPE